MTAGMTLRLNGDMKRDSPMMEVVRRFRALCSRRGLSYCIVGGMAVIRNGYPRTTMGIDILTHRDEWMKMLPLEGEISSEGIDQCVDGRTGVRIDVLFADWGMPTGMPDPGKAGEFDEELGATFMGLHDLVQMKAAVYLSKLREQGEDVASKDRSDVFELISRNLSRFSKEIVQAYHPAVREHCMTALDAAVRLRRDTDR
jgi:hypothetical protein